MRTVGPKPNGDGVVMDEGDRAGEGRVHWFARRGEEIDAEMHRPARASAEASRRHRPCRCAVLAVEADGEIRTGLANARVDQALGTVGIQRRPPGRVRASGGQIERAPGSSRRQA